MSSDVHDSGLTAQVRCSTPQLCVDLDVAAGETLAVIGPNGAGKSTLMSILAGLRRAPGSTVRVGGRVLQDGENFVAPHRRSVVLLEQKARLFPHLNVRRNVAFGPASAGLSRTQVAQRTERWMAATGVADLGERRPSQLSGGQAQRVAIARALATEPDVLLLDEPFAALDVDVAQQMRSLLRSLLAERSGCTVMVTHDLVDVVGLADSVAVIDDGALAQSGTTTAVLTHPDTPFVASLSGVNLVIGEISGPNALRGAAGLSVIGSPVESLSDGAAAAAAFSPRAVVVYQQAPQGSPRNIWDGMVVAVIPRGDHALVQVECGGEHQMISAEVTWDAVTEIGLGPGSRVCLVVKASEVRIYARATHSA